jgi:2,4-dienoyl-CoA reductase-like NADH-dependent reductase (Old Yellow Enzyme family)
LKFNIYLSINIKKLTGKPTITVGSIGLDTEFIRFFAEGKGAKNVNLDELIERFEREEFDLVAVGRALLVDPSWVKKIRDGRVEELMPFTAEATKILF